MFMYYKKIKSEIASLNRTIDRKILRGLDYSDEARRHKMLRAQIRKVRQHRTHGLGTFMRFASFL